MSYRLGVDIGGTFTDLALYDVERDRIEFAKTPSTPADQTLAVAEGVRLLVERHGLDPADIGFFIHGHHRRDQHPAGAEGGAHRADNHRWLPRRAADRTAGSSDAVRLAGAEGGAADTPPAQLRGGGARAPHREVLAPLETEAARGVIERVRREEVDAVAVCLLHSYANPAHERTIGELLAAELPGVTVALSSDVLPEFKEFDRMSTTAINAYVAPGTARYLRALDARIAGAGVETDVHIMQSNGGITGAETAAGRPVRTVLSGPAAGVIGGVALAAQAGEPNAITVDMGGTSFDISLSYDGEVRHTQDSEIEGFPVKVPMVDIHTLGAGGGSIAWIDAGGALRVGPQSAGAEPGPPCYGRGGTEPTVTDANLVLGRLSAASLLGGRDAPRRRAGRPRHRGAHRRAPRHRVGSPCGSRRCAWTRTASSAPPWGSGPTVRRGSCCAPSGSTRPP